MQRMKAFTLIELLVVIAIIAVLMAILMPSLQAVKRQASASNCLANQKTLITAWLMYANDYDGKTVSNGACYDEQAMFGGAPGHTAWVHRPKLESGAYLPVPAPESITLEDRLRGIKSGTLWKYVEDVGAYHCPGDMRKSAAPPKDCWRSYSISYAFGHNGKGGAYRNLSEIQNGSLYYVFVEEEHAGTLYGENEGGWALRGINKINDSSAWQFYDPLATYHLKASTFSFADGHAIRRKWKDPRTLDIIEQLRINNQGNISSDGNPDLRWLIEHFWSKKRANMGPFL